MEKRKKILHEKRKGGVFLKKVLGIVLTVLLVFSTMSVSVFAENEDSEITKAKRKYEIAVVYDNSGSMYGDESWCRAKYAMEIFASMLNYDEGDKLSIFPMWEVTTSGDENTPPAGESIENTDIIQIESQKDVTKISKMLTLNADGTPITQVDRAYNYLSGINDETVTDKWLIVLTDGRFDDENGKKMESSKVEKTLLSKANNGIKVQYLGFGSEAATFEENVNAGFYAKTSKNATELRKDLIDICNTIFKRSRLDDEYYDGKNLELEISMNKVIVFIQGKNAEIVSLNNNSTGEQIKITSNSGKIIYSKLGAADYKDAPYDDSLYGQVVTFGECKADQYTIDYKGATNVEIFYEPNVDIKIVMKKDGKEIDYKKDTVYPGEYSFEYLIVDKSTGKDVTESDLLGDDVDINGTAKITNGEKTREEKLESGGTLDLKAGDEIFFNVTGTYLEDYTITTKDNMKEHTINIEDFPDVPKFDADINVLQEDDWYTLKDRESWKPIKVSFTVGGETLTDEQMKRVAANFTIEPELPFTYEIIPGESALAVHIAKDENGNDIIPDSETGEPDITGNYDIKVTAKYTDENGKVSNEATDDDSFKIEKYSPLVFKIIGLILLLALAILIHILRHRPAFPSNMLFYRRGANGNYFPEGGETIFPGDSFVAELDGRVIFEGEAKKVTPWCDRKKTSASTSVKVTSYRGDISNLYIGGEKIILANETVVDISDGTSVRVVTNNGVQEDYEIRVNSEIETNEED